MRVCVRALDVCVGVLCKPPVVPRKEDEVEGGEEGEGVAEEGVEGFEEVVGVEGEEFEKGS